MARDVTLLIVDDQPTVRDALACLMAARGFKTRTAADGPEALRIASSEVVHAALVDIDMPIMLGFEVCRRLQTLSGKLGRPIRTWLMTGAYTHDAALEGRAAGALKVFQKPFMIAELCAEIERAL